VEKPQYCYKDGNLSVNGRAYTRPCDWAADCGAEMFLGGSRTWTPAAVRALAMSLQGVCPLRGMPNDFLVFAVGLKGSVPSSECVPSSEGSVPTVCALCCAPTTLTVRFEDIWHMLPPESRAFSYACDMTRDPNSKDVPSAQAEGVVRESLTGLAPDARICLDLAENGGFVLSFRPEP